VCHSHAAGSGVQGAVSGDIFASPRSGVHLPLVSHKYQKSPLIPVVTFLVAALLSPLLPAQSAANRSVYEFCARRLGQQVGDGICQTLVDAALVNAGLPAGHRGREVWSIANTSGGVRIRGDYRNVSQGDIIWMRDIFPDRYRYAGTPEPLLRRGNQLDNHIGVVESIDADGVRYLNQNAGRQKRVRLDYFPFSEIGMLGEIIIYRP